MPSPPAFRDLRRAIADLERLLASFDQHPGARLAREGEGLSGDSRTQWDEAEATVVRARATLHEVTRLVGHAERRARERAGATDSAPTLGRTADGDHPQRAALEAGDAVKRALVLAGRIEVARTQMVPRARRAEAEAAGAGQADAATRAGDLARRITSDPLSDAHESDLHDVERQAVSAGLCTAYDRLDELRVLVEQAACDAEHAMSRIAGFRPPCSPGWLRSRLAELAVRLDRIRAASRTATDGSSGHQLGVWRADAAELDRQACAVQEAADKVMARRAHLRGVLGTLNEKAGRLDQVEGGKAGSYLEQADKHLYAKPADLATAESILRALSALLDGARRGSGAMTGGPTTCDRPGCDGTIDDMGICVACWLPPLRSTPEAHPPVEPPGEQEAEDAPAGAEPSDDGPALRSGHSWVGAGIVYVPPAPEIAPEDAVMADPHIPEASRRCGTCNAPVGRTVGGSAALESGYCNHCGARYDFVVKLHPGELVAGQYEVVGVLGYGGQGWTYLARDVHVDNRLCVLKGRRDTYDPAAAEAEELERRWLAELQHPGIVEIYNFVEHRTGGDGDGDDADTLHRYIVMAFANGRDLSYIRERDKLPATHAVAYVHAALPALGYLHERGFVYCDLKPENMIHSGDAVVLVDLGAAWSEAARSAVVYSTVHYRAPELDESGPTVATDIYAVGRTLVALLTGSPNAWPPADSEVRRHDGLRRFVERACAARPEQRFADTDEAAESLLGALCQVAAATDSKPRHPRSTRWGSPRPQLEPFRWDELPSPILPAQPFRTPGGASGDLSWADRASLAQAQCRIADFAAATTTVDGMDPAATEVATWPTAPAGDGDRAARRPGRRTRITAVVETARTYLRATVQQAAGEAGSEAVTVQGVSAVDLFRTAYHEAPGELACALALAAALEAAAGEATAGETTPSDATRTARLHEAEVLYRQVAVTNPNWVGAVTGLQRVLVALERPEDAANELLKVPDDHPLRLEALALACGVVPPGKYNPDVARKAAEELARARARPHRRPIEEAHLAASLYEMALEALPDHEDLTDPVDGHPASADGLASARAAALHEQAMATPAGPERYELLDAAAQVRPWRNW